MAWYHVCPQQPFQMQSIQRQAVPRFPAADFGPCQPVNRRISKYCRSSSFAVEVGHKELDDVNVFAGLIGDLQVES